MAPREWAAALRRVIQVPTELSPGETQEAPKKGTLLVLVLLCSMGWGSTHVFQPKNVGSTQELGFTLVEWTLTSKVLSKFPYSPMQN